MVVPTVRLNPLSNAPLPSNYPKSTNPLNKPTLPESPQVADINPRMTQAEGSLKTITGNVNEGGANFGSSGKPSPTNRLEDNVKNKEAAANAAKQQGDPEATTKAEAELAEATEALETQTAGRGTASDILRSGKEMKSELKEALEKYNGNSPVIEVPVVRKGMSENFKIAEEQAFDQALSEATSINDLRSKYKNYLKRNVEADIKAFSKNGKASPSEMKAELRARGIEITDAEFDDLVNTLSKFKLKKSKLTKAKVGIAALGTVVSIVIGSMALFGKRNPVDAINDLSDVMGEILNLVKKTGAGAFNLVSWLVDNMVWLIPLVLGIIFLIFVINNVSKG